MAQGYDETQKGFRKTSSHDVKKVESRQIKMERGQMTTSWTVSLVDDNIFEGVESFKVFLTHPLVGGIDPNPKHSTVADVIISDPEDST